MKRVVAFLAGWMLFLSAGVVVRARQDVPSIIASSLHWADTRDSRRAQAAEWLSEVTKLNDEIPTLSPAEQAWLKVEYDDEIARAGGHFTPRASRARYGKEGSARFAKPIAQQMVSILRQLASTSALSQKAEVTLWSQLGYLALDGSFWGDVSTLGDLGVLPRGPNWALGSGGMPTYKELITSLWAARVQEILHGIVLPYLS
jgi:hypothetical protein